MVESNEILLHASTVPAPGPMALAPPGETSPHFDPASPARILVVDDTSGNRKLMKTILAKEKYEVLEANHGAEAIALAGEASPDLILLDVMMPLKDGYQVCEELKLDPRTREIPVIFLSGRSESEDKVKGLELGAVDFITKPFSRGEILARVRMHLEMRLLSRSLQAMNAELMRRQDRIREDLRAAANIQRSLIPPEDLKTRFKELELAWQFLPCESVGGDVFNLYRLDKDHVGLFVVDVSGHGVPAAMVTVSVAQMLSPQGGKLLKLATDDAPYYRLPGPEEIFHLLDQHFPLERFQKHFTISYLLLNMKNGRVRYCRAAHPAPMLLRAGGEIRDLMAGGTLIGFGEDVRREEGEIHLQPGDRVFLYTDGMVEYPNPAGERFGSSRFRDALARSRGLPLQGSCDAVVQEISAHACGLAAPDDMTIFGLEYRGSSK